MRGSQLAQDLFKHALSLSQGLVVPESDYTKPLGLQNGRPPGIVCGLLQMLAAIKFYDQSLLEADEVDRVRRNRVLSAKLESTEIAILQKVPDA